MKHSQPIDQDSWWKVADYARGVCPEEESVRLEEHLIECGACRKALAEVDELLQVLEGEGLLGSAPTPSGSPEACLRRIQDLIALRSGGTPSENSLQNPASPTPGEEPPPTQNWKEWDPSDFGLSRKEEIDWEETAFEGIRVKRLFVTPNREFATMLVEMDAGSSYPAHRHGGAEQCYVLEGDLRAGERVMNGGDFEVVSGGSHHPVQWTKEGCRLLIVSSTKDEFVSG